MLAFPPKHTGPRHLQRIWRGEPLAGKRVLVRCYHGLGDTIQFLRFMRPLRNVARQVTVWCQRDLLPLVERSAGVDRAIALHDGAPEVDFEVDIEIMEVPHAIKATSEHVATMAPYVALPLGEMPQFIAGNGLSVGLVWEVGAWDKRRSIPPALLHRLAVAGVTLYSLQLGTQQSDLAKIGARDISAPDIASLCDRLRQLDLVVCVDTMLAHLAGATGCEAWVLLHSDCDWRWPLSGSRSLWYPSLRLFHQTKPGEWESVVQKVAERLEHRARQSAATA
ncbi:hypothetical protein [Bradyrhizobium sp. CCGB20]|nr:hypothetical protein [Bradyrhizobium sp. CCGB20]MCP3402112.1 hypothetical protein [Bradyrhizobium sp. CCGB20]